jgi:Ni2+-binding GTPase involved in maturation of urease and hydrogenase
VRPGIRQHDPRFISRLTELRQAVDVLSTSNPVRLLQVIGSPGAGKSSLLDRAIEELDYGVTILFVSADRLLKAHDAVGDLCRYVAELIRRGR